MTVARSQPVSTARPATAALCVISALAAAAAVLFLIDPAASNLYPACPFYALTGLYCPGCGSLRALHQLLHADFAAAFSLNPLMVLFLPLLAYESLKEGLLYWNGRRLPSLLSGALMSRAALALILAFWVLRNIPMHPFSLLAP
jgi:hypothetical protein